MKCSEGRAEAPRRLCADTWLWAWIAMLAVSLCGCEAAMTKAPSITAPIASKPSGDVLVSDGAPSACFANSYACGGFFPRIGAWYGDYLIQGDDEIGAWTRTWLPGGGTAYLSAVGKATVYRQGYESQTFQLACSNSASECHDGFHTWNTCNVSHNEIHGTTTHEAQGALKVWEGRFSDSRTCDPPPGNEMACDENGTPVDEGGDPANCPTDDSSDDGDPTPTGTQFYPGDYTNGETVDFATGIGDGGTSVCGSAAQVEQICIDIWDEANETWQPYACGYATTC